MFGFQYGGMPDIRTIRHRFLVEWVAGMSKLPKSPRILDYGCGAGHASIAFRELIPTGKLHMADIEDLREHCRDALFSLLPMDSAKIPLEDGSVDILFASEVLEHVPNLLETMMEMHRVLSPKGYLVGSVPNFSHIHSRMAFWRGEGYRNAARLPMGGHLNFITRQFLLKLVSTYFRLIKEGGDVDFLAPYFFMPKFIRDKWIKTDKRRLGYSRTNAKFSWYSYDYLFVFKRGAGTPPSKIPRTSEAD